MTIINSRYNYIFIHIPKSAGKSVKEHLAKNTFDFWEREKLMVSNALQAASTYASSTSFPKKLIPSPLGLGVVDERVRDYCAKRKLPTAAHLRADELREALGANEFEALFSFAFVRNPWDRCLSSYFYFQRKPFHPLRNLANELSFEEFLLLQEGNGMPYVGQQTQWIFKNYEEKLVDFIGKVERIEEDMAKVNEIIGLEDRSFASHTNVSQARKRDYRPYYSDEAREVVERSMKPDIDLLGYSF